MAYKGNSGRGKRPSSGRRSSGDDSAKRTWNQRTSHEDDAASVKTDRAPREGGETMERRPGKRNDERGTFKRERTASGDPSDKSAFVKSNENTGEGNLSEGVEKKGDRPYSDRGDRKPFPRKDNFYGDRKDRREGGERDSGRERKPYEGRGEGKPFRRREASDDRKPFRGDVEKGERSFSRSGANADRTERKPFSGRAERKPYPKKDSYGDKKNYRIDSEKRERSSYSESGERKSYPRDTVSRDKNKFSSEGTTGFDRSERKGSFSNPQEGDASDFKRPYVKKTDGKRNYDNTKRSNGYDRKPLRKRSDRPSGNDAEKEKFVFKYPDGTVRPEKLTRLNKYIANSGICSRREADELIKAGLVSVNGVIVTEMGIQVSRTDIVKYNNTAIRKERKVYVLLNKPKDYITTTDDPGERKTVMSLVENACKERIYPVGRLDRNTTGLLLVTNDGELTKKLTHPSSNIKKIYHVELDKNLATSDLKKIAAGIELEDGFIKVDEINYDGDGLDKSQVGIAIHSGKNRIVRRIFESLGYEVRKLDRVIFAGLTKKDLPRGKWRNLSEMEVNMLKMIAGTR